LSTNNQRLWQCIAEDIARETDSQRIFQLADEMYAAIAEQGIISPEDFALIGEIRRRIKQKRQDSPTAA
jgi:hypothetical protein